MDNLPNFFTLPFQIDFNSSTSLLLLATILMIFICFQLIRSKDLVESLIMLSIFSITLSLCYLLMDAPDVAMTETALGACLSTCVILNLIKIWGPGLEGPQRVRFIASIILCLLLAGCLIWGGMDLPQYGTENSPMQQHLTKYYLENTAKEIAIPSFVAAILASYRGYDTLGETSVILIAGLAVVMILGRKRSEK